MQNLSKFDCPVMETPEVSFEAENRNGCLPAMVVAFAGTVLVLLLVVTRVFERRVVETLETKSAVAVASLRELQRIPSPVLNHKLSQLAIQLAEQEQDNTRERALLATFEQRASNYETRIRSLRDQFEKSVDDACRLVQHNPNQVRSILSWALSVADLQSETKLRWEAEVLALPKPRVELPNLQLIVSDRSSDRNEIICEVIDRNKAHFSGLTVVDFSVLDQHDREWPHFEVLEQHGIREESSIVMLLDGSSSMDGPKLDQLKKGVTQFSNALNTLTTAKVVSFGSNIQPLTAYTNTPSTLSSAIQKVKADGTTELAQGLETSIDDLAKRNGKRFILLCTDGNDPKLRSRLPVIVANSRKHNVQITVLAIRDKSLDIPLLTELATKTGGSILEAEDPPAIARKLQEFAATHTAPKYVIRIFAPGQPITNFQVRLFTAPAQKQLIGRPL